MAGSELVHKGTTCRNRMVGDRVLSVGSGAMMSNNGIKGFGMGGGGPPTGSNNSYRWNGDAVPLKRRRVGLSNGGSMSDAESSEAEEHEEEEEEYQAAVEQFSDEGDGVADGGEDYEEDEANEEYDEDQEDFHDNHVAAMDRGGKIVRGREPVGYIDNDVGSDDDGFDEEVAVPDSPIVRGRGRERPNEMSSPEGERDMIPRGRGRDRVVEVSSPVRDVMPRGRGRDRPIEMSSPEDGRDMMPRGRGREREREIEMSSPEDGRDISDDSDEEKPLPVSRAIVDRGQSSASEARREMIVVPEKAPIPKPMVNTAKRKAEAPLRHGAAVAAPKPKKEKPPPALKKKANGDAPPRDRARFSTDNKARVTLERAREILAAVKANMPKDAKPVIRRLEAHAVDNSSRIADDRAARKPPPPSRVVTQAKSEEKVVKSKSRPVKGDKEPTPRKRKPKVEIDNNAADQKLFARKPQVEGSVHEHTLNGGRHSVDSDDLDSYEKKDFGNGGHEQKTIVVEKKVRKRKKVKEADGNAGGTGICPGSLLRDENWVPPSSPFGLIQESLYKDPWKVLLSCMLLNKSAGRQFNEQMHKVIWDLFSLCPDAETAINMDNAKIAEKVYSLGLQNKRAKMIQRFSLEYLRGSWTNVTQLHGIGKYAADAYAIFCQGLWREVEPEDHMLVKYWQWLRETEGLGSAFAPENP